MVPRHLIAAFLSAVLVALAGGAVPSDLRIEFLHKLADFTGTVPFQAARVLADPQLDEAFVLDGRTVRIFGSTGMETYSVEIAPEEGAFIDLAVDEAGDIFLLGYGSPVGTGSGSFSLLRCDFRGEPIGRVAPRGLPPSLEHFRPNAMVYRDGRFYLLSTLSFEAIVLDRRGKVLNAYDVAPHFGFDRADGLSAEIRGFAVDGAGNMYFSVPVKFLVAVVSPDGTARTFGEPGSRPGKFGLVGPLAVDDSGYIYVGDLLRSVVMVFTPELEFTREFGGYGLGDENLVRPSNLSISPGGKLFVSQMRAAGVSVYRVSEGSEG